MIAVLACGGGPTPVPTLAPRASDDYVLFTDGDFSIELPAWPEEEPKVYLPFVACRFSSEATCPHHYRVRPVFLPLVLRNLSTLQSC
jgi:non-ribosomal peptide synthetase component E (peptide arylation enzyme)